MAREDDEDPGLPIKLGPCSNGEYEPEPLPPVLRETIGGPGRPASTTPGEPA
jgi:hypothetical protein